MAVPLVLAYDKNEALSLLRASNYHIIKEDITFAPGKDISGGVPRVVRQKTIGPGCVELVYAYQEEVTWLKSGKRNK